MLSTPVLAFGDVLEKDPFAYGPHVNASQLYTGPVGIGSLSRQENESKISVGLVSVSLGVQSRLEPILFLTTSSARELGNRVIAICRH